MKRIVIVGATSGIGLEVAKRYIAAGWQVGAAGRNREALEQIRTMAPQQVLTEQLDVTREDAPARLNELIEKLGGMDLFLLTSGIGYSNYALDPGPEIATVDTNTVGFTRMVTAAYAHFRTRRGGHLAVVSSIAGTKGLGSAPAYSASKRFQSNYIDALAQLARMERLDLRFTDIRPGFVATRMLKHPYPMLMRPDRVAGHIFRALERRRRRVVVDGRYAVLVFFWRLLPEWLWERMKVKSRD